MINQDYAMVHWVGIIITMAVVVLAGWLSAFVRRARQQHSRLPIRDLLH